MNDSNDDSFTFIVVRTSDAKRMEITLPLSKKLADLKRRLADADFFGPDISLEHTRIFHLGRELKSSGRSLCKMGLGKFNNHILHLHIRQKHHDPMCSINKHKSTTTTRSSSTTTAAPPLAASVQQPPSTRGQKRLRAKSSTRQQQQQESNQNETPSESAGIIDLLGDDEADDDDDDDIEIDILDDDDDDDGSDNVEAFSTDNSDTDIKRSRVS